MSMRNLLEIYFLEHPLALNVILFLLQQEKGMTATELAEEFGVSVPTMYRLTLEMQRLGLLEVTKKGRKNVFTVNSELSKDLPQIAERIKTILRKTPPIEQKLLIARKMLSEYPMPLSPRATQLLLSSVFKHKVLENLPHGIRKKQLRTLNVMLGERLRPSIIVGNDKGLVGIEFKILETPKHVRDLLGFISALTLLRERGLRGLVVVCVICSLQNKWLINPEELYNLLSFQDRKEFRILPIVECASRLDLLSPEFIERLAKDAIAKVEECTNYE